MCGVCSLHTLHHLMHVELAMIREDKSANLLTRGSPLVIFVPQLLEGSLELFGKLEILLRW